MHKKSPFANKNFVAGLLVDYKKAFPVHEIHSKSMAFSGLER